MSMPKTCDICNKKLGSKNSKLNDGLACADCIRKAGLVPRKKLLLNIEDVKNVIAQNESEAAITQNNNAPIKKKKKHGCLITVLVLLVAFIALCITLPLVIDTPDTLSSMTKTIMTTCEVNETEANAIVDILNSCDITKIDKIEYDELLFDMWDNNERGYRLSSAGANNIIMYLSEDNTIYKIVFSARDIYAEGQVIHGIKYYMINSDEKSKLNIASQTLVDEVLTAPSTAKYPLITEWSFSKDFDKNIIQVSSYVDAQNAFGANIRNDFIIQYQITGDIEKGEFYCVYFKLGDTVISDIRE